MYHRVNSDLGRSLGRFGVTPGALEGQMDWLRRRGYRGASLEALVEHLRGASALPRRSVVLTFDDGYLDTVLKAGPILEAAGFTAIMYLVVDRVGGLNEWDRRYGDPPRSLVSWPEARRLDGRVFRFEVHSRTHPNLTLIDRARARDEIFGAKDRFEQEMGRPATGFSYPHGEFDGGLDALVAEAGFRSAVTDRVGLNRRGDDPMRIRRTMIGSRDLVPTFALKVATGLSPRGVARDLRRRWRRRTARAGAPPLLR